jgi:hypothetical protein
MPCDSSATRDDGITIAYYRLSTLMHLQGLVKPGSNLVLNRRNEGSGVLEVFQHYQFGSWTLVGRCDDSRGERIPTLYGQISGFLVFVN